jgi:hypothetical protein
MIALKENSFHDSRTAAAAGIAPALQNKTAGPDEIERIFINHCSLVLFGGKPSALFIVRTKKCYFCLMDVIHQFDNEVSSIVLRRTQNGFLVFFYKPDTLNDVIMEPDIQKLLRSFGYPVETSGLYGSRRDMPVFNFLQSSLNILRLRFLACQEFPHEIGFFLGYPSEDVLGFIQQKGKNYKYCGLWKVYGSVKKAMDIFRHYEICREKSKNYLVMESFPNPAKK